jgi:DNA-binding response OmpR family regulator
MKRRILLVDDELAVLLTLKTVLEMHGFEVSTANSAAEAITKLAAEPYHMVITDLRMESENAGWEVVRVARELKDPPATAILTAYPHLGNDGHNSGSQSILVKPVGTKDLIRQIEALLVSHEDVKQRRANHPQTPADIPADQRPTTKVS